MYLKIINRLVGENWRYILYNRMFRDNIGQNRITLLKSNYITATYHDHVS
jgi:hypothetical protein